MHRDSEENIFNYKVSGGDNVSEEALIQKINKDLMKGNQNNYIQKDEARRKKLKHVQKIIMEIKAERKSAGTLVRSMIPERKNREELQKPLISMSNAQKIEIKENAQKLKSSMSQSSVGNNHLRENMKLHLAVLNSTLGADFDVENRRRMALNLVDAVQRRVKNCRENKSKTSLIASHENKAANEGRIKKIFTYEESCLNRDELDIEETILEKFFRAPRTTNNANGALKKKKKVKQMSMDKRSKAPILPSSPTPLIRMATQETVAREKEAGGNVTSFASLPFIKTDSGNYNPMQEGGFAMSAHERQLTGEQTPKMISSSKKSPEEIKADRALGRQNWSKRAKAELAGHAAGEKNEAERNLKETGGKSLSISEFDETKKSKTEENAAWSKDKPLIASFFADPNKVEKSIQEACRIKSGRLRKESHGNVPCLQKENSKMGLDFVVNPWPLEMQQSGSYFCQPSLATPNSKYSPTTAKSSPLAAEKPKPEKMKPAGKKVTQEHEKKKAVDVLKQKIQSAIHKKPKIEEQVEDFTSPILKSVQGYVTRKSFNSFRFGYLAFHSQQYQKLPIKFRNRELQQADQSGGNQEEAKARNKLDIPALDADENEKELEKLKRVKDSKNSNFQVLLSQKLLNSRNEFYRRRMFPSESISIIQRGSPVEEPEAEKAKQNMVGFFKSLDTFSYQPFPAAETINKIDLEGHNLQLKVDLKHINQKLKSFEDNMLANFFHPERLHQEGV